MSFEIRAATREHTGALCDLARYLDTVNLPDDPKAIEALLDRSERSFAREIEDPHKREYVFVLWDLEAERAIATSMVVGQLGRRDAPYIYFAVRREEKYSATLDRHFVHTILTTSYSYNGPTEIGGLVVRPECRRRPERFGTLISYVRFLFVAARRAEMQDELLAELLPPLLPDGTSHLWEAVGRRFTGLSYREADRLSRNNKEFIKGLFPDDIYATLLSPEAQAVIGEVGEQTRGVEGMLRRIGFRHAERVDPFDGGPHFLARTDEVSLVRATQSAPASLIEGSVPPDAGSALVALDAQAPPYFRARLLAHAGEVAFASRRVCGELRAVPSDRMWVLPLRGRRAVSARPAESD